LTWFANYGVDGKARVTVLVEQVDALDMHRNTAFPPCSVNELEQTNTLKLGSKFEWDQPDIPADL
jgi:hypothetical protein